MRSSLAQKAEAASGEIDVAAQPAYSPDGSQIAFAIRDGNNDIFIMRINGMDVSILTNHTTQDLHPVWHWNSFPESLMHRFASKEL